MGPKLIMPFADVAGNVVKTLVNNGLLPLTSLFIEPAKVLFLNNAINHGVLTPLGTNQALADGKSILFLLEANPGPGLGLLLAYMVFGKGMARASAPALRSSTSSVASTRSTSPTSWPSRSSSSR
jgi:PTS system mannitol-specific IIC component